MNVYNKSYAAGYRAFRSPLTANPLLVLGVLLAQGVHVGSMFDPGWRDVLQIEPVTLQV